MSLGKWHPNVRSPSSKSSAVKSIPHGLNRHSCSSKCRTTARTSLKNWNKSVCSNRAESTSQRTAPLLNMAGMEEEVLWYHVVLQDDNARPHRARIVQQSLQQNSVDHLDWPARSPDVANRACLVHSRPACTTESSRTKNAPSFGRSLAGGVEEDTPATDCQTHQEYASSLFGLHRCNRWTYAILTDLWGFIGDPSDLPYKFSHSHLVLQTPTDGFLSVNEMM